MGLKDKLLRQLQKFELISLKQFREECKKNREYPLIIESKTLTENLEKLAKAEKIVIKGESEKYLIPITNRFNFEQIKQRTIEFIKNSLFDEQLKVYGYDQLEDDLDLEYLLLIDFFADKEKLRQYLEENIYVEKEFENNLALFMPQTELFDWRLKDSLKKLIAVEKAIAKEDTDFLSSFSKQLQEKIRNDLTTKFGYYISWDNSKENELNLVKAKADNMLETVKTDFELLEKHLIAEIQKKDGGVEAKTLFKQYRFNREYPFVKDYNDFKQAIKNLVKEDSLYKIEASNKIYDSLDTIISELAVEIEVSSTKKRLAEFIVDKLFEQDFLVYGYDEIIDTPDLKYVLLLDVFESEEKLSEFLLNNIYSDREFNNNLVLVQAKNDLLNSQLLNKMKKIMAIEKLEKPKLKAKFNALLNQLKKESITQLKDDFGYYLYWENKNDQSQLCKTEIKAQSLSEEIQTDFNKLKLDIIKRVKEQEGIKLKGLLLDYKKIKEYPLITEDSLFYQILNELQAENDIIIDKENNKLYSNVDKFIQARVDDVELTDAKAKLMEFINQQLFNSQAMVYGYDKIPDDEQMKYVLLLNNFKEKQELASLLKKDIYQGRKFKNTLLIITPKINLFQASYFDKIKLIMTIEHLKEKITLGKEQLETALEEKTKQLQKSLKDAFGNYLNWTKDGEELELEQETFVMESLAEPFNSYFENSLADVKENMIEIVKEQELIKVKDLLIQCKTKLAYPMINNEDLFYQVIKKLKQEDFILSVEKEDSYLAILPKVDQELKLKLATFIRDNLFGKKYNIFPYDKIADDSDFKYVLLLKSFANNQELQNYLAEEFYQDREFENNFLMLCPKEKVYTTEIFAKIKEIVVMKKIIDFSENKKQFSNNLLTLKDSLLKDLEGKFAYFINWVNEYEVYREEIELDNILAQIKIDFSELKQDVKEKIKKHKGIEVEELLLIYKKDRSYPLLLDEDLFYQAIKELETDKQIINDKTTKRVYKSTSSLINDTVGRISKEQAEKELLDFITSKLFKDKYKTYQNFDEFGANDDYVLFLKGFETVRELKQFIKQDISNKKINQEEIVLITPKRNIFNNNFITKIKLILALTKVQKKIDWEERKISLVLERQTKKLLEQLRAVFGNYIYCRKKEDSYEIHQEKMKTSDLI